MGLWKVGQYVLTAPFMRCILENRVVRATGRHDRLLDASQRLARG